MPNPVDLPSLKPGERVQDSLLVLDVEARATTDGNPYTVLVLGNSTGRISTEPFWIERQDAVAGMRRGHVVQVIGEVTRYRDRPQLKVVSVRPPSSSRCSRRRPAADRSSPPRGRQYRADRSAATFSTMSMSPAG